MNTVLNPMRLIIFLQPSFPTVGNVCSYSWCLTHMSKHVFLFITEAYHTWGPVRHRGGCKGSVFLSLGGSSSCLHIRPHLRNISPTKITSLETCWHTFPRHSLLQILLLKMGEFLRHYQTLKPVQCKQRHVPLRAAPSLCGQLLARAVPGLQESR